MGDKLIIKSNFRVFVPQGQDDEGRDRPDRRVEYTTGMVVAVADIPEGQTAEDWKDKGLAEDASPRSREPAAPLALTSTEPAA